MKKFNLLEILIVVVMVGQFIAYSFAAELEDTDQIYWDWCGPTPIGSGFPSESAEANDLRWHLYMRLNQKDFDYTKPPAFVANYADSNATATQNNGDLKELSMNYKIPIVALGGKEVDIHFVLRAFYDDGESGSSNEVTKTVIMPNDQFIARIPLQ